ncbi:cobyric acid synthase [Sediminimonas qiaohouensis]|uniref:cobyric acid synthase n=1 Tax=Sediminimonas qiaohouensis TaxID=552061 RepID=UPI0003FC933C|nr:cobyric acid synthase [Sediminimonas qiaohouensis]
MTRAIMIQGAGSNVGKSMIVAGCLRALRNRGLSVRPLKPQNMSNNAAVTPEGGEIGRAQFVQARAAGVPAHTDMNPVLLKPESETGAQIILQGKRLDRQDARAYAASRDRLLVPVMESFRRVCTGADVVIVEGAGSPAEINLRDRDIANMGFAEAANIPVLLLGDIDRGGVIAQIVGTQAVLSPSDAAHIKGFAINKFRGDLSLFDDGVTAIEDRTGWPGLGVIPWFDNAWRLPAEDMLDLTSRPGGPVKVAVPHLPRMANFDDLDPLSAEPDITLEIIPPGRPLPGDAQLVLIPGSKSTIADLEFFRAQGWHIDLEAHVRRGGHVLGLCGGYQMLGNEIADPEGVEGTKRHVTGLGLLNVATVMQPKKHLSQTRATYIPTGAKVNGYEIHLGQTDGPDCGRPWLDVDGTPHGATSVNGRVRGCYLHGLFTSDGLRKAYLSDLGGSSAIAYETELDEVLDELAAHIEKHMDINKLIDISGEV